MWLCLVGKHRKWIYKEGWMINTARSCKDDQTSADAQEGGKATGAMSYAFTSGYLL